MGLFQRLFRRKKHPNPAINALHYSVGSFDPKVSEMILLLPKLSETFQEGGAYLLQKTLLTQFKEYDAQYGANLSEEVNEEKSKQMLVRVMSLMLVVFFKELSRILPDGPYPSALSDALHYEIYGALPGKESFIAYLTYENPNFEDAKMSPAFKFGNDISEIVSVSDLSFSFMAAQQVAVISDIASRLTRWVLFNEPIESV